VALHSNAGLLACKGERRSPVRPHRNERGFALLLVFLMASVFAITLYIEMPRVAMESERAKEALLIDRGEQYKRAIQLFTKKAQRYPGDIKELESFQNTRFLRHRYIDPMTGKDEWRIIHIQGGVLTDSKLSAPQKPGEEKKDNGSFAGVENTFATAGGANQQGGAAMAQRRRASDGSMAGMGPELPPVQAANGTSAPGSGPQLLSGQQNLGNPIQPGQPNQIQPIPGVAIPGQPGVNGQPGGFPGQPVGQPGNLQGQPGNFQGQPGNFQGQPGVFPGQQLGGAAGGRPFPGQQPGGGATSSSNAGAGAGGGNSFGGGGNSFAGPTTPSGMPAQPGQVVYQGQPLPGQPGAPVNSQNGGASPYPTFPGGNGNPQTGGASPYPTFPGANGTPPGINQPGGVATPQNQAASDMINRILTSPRPGGMPSGAQTGGAALGGGIAGVASNAEGEGIMVYNDHTLYSEWEFIFDPAKQKQIQNPNASGAPGTPAQRLGNTPGGTPGTPVPPAGTNSGSFGNPSSFSTPSPSGTQTPRPGR
jgi:uncharacterized membrane protein YgcG